MKKIIDGAKYDTDTAKFLAESGNDGNTRDFSWCKEELYRTKSGKYFIYGRGGPMSRYAESAGNNSWGSGTKILPLSRQAAQEWAEEKLEAEEYEQIFGEVSEDDGKEPLNLLIPATLKAKLWAAAEEQHKTISEIVENILVNNA